MNHLNLIILFFFIIVHHFAFSFEIDLSKATSSVLSKKMIKIEKALWDGVPIGKMELTWDAASNSFKVTSIAPEDPNQDPPPANNLNGKWKVEWDSGCNKTIENVATLVIQDQDCLYNQMKCQTTINNNNFRLTWPNVRDIEMKGTFNSMNFQADRFSGGKYTGCYTGSRIK